MCFYLLMVQNVPWLIYDGFLVQRILFFALRRISLWEWHKINLNTKTIQNVYWLKGCWFQHCHPSPFVSSELAISMKYVLSLMFSIVGGEWNDAQCNSLIPFVCKIPKSAIQPWTLGIATSWWPRHTPRSPLIHHAFHFHNDSNMAAVWCLYNASRARVYIPLLLMTQL